MSEHPKEVFRRIEYDKATKRARWLYCNKSKPGADEVRYIPAPQGETWAEMRDRHALEKAEAVMSLEAIGMTQTEAAKVLEMRLVDLNNFVKRNGLTWRVVRQGFASRDPESLSPYGVNNPPAGERMQ